MATQQALFRSQSGAMSGRKRPTFGQSRFWPIPFWPIQSNLANPFFDHLVFGPANLGHPILATPILDQSNFGQSIFWIWCVSCVGSRRGRSEGWGPNPEKIGPRRVGAQNVGSFFTLSPPFRSFSLFLGDFSWNFGVFDGRDPQMCTFGFFGLSCESSSGFGAVPAFENTKIQRGRHPERVKQNEIGVGEGQKKAKFWAVRRRGPASDWEGPDQQHTTTHNNTQQHTQPHTTTHNKQHTTTQQQQIGLAKVGHNRRDFSFPPSFPLLLLRWLWLPFPLVSRTCRCGRLLDVLGPSPSIVCEGGCSRRSWFLRGSHRFVVRELFSKRQERRNVLQRAAALHGIRPPFFFWDLIVTTLQKFIH